MLLIRRYPGFYLVKSHMSVSATADHFATVPHCHGAASCSDDRGGAVLLSDIGFTLKDLAHDVAEAKAFIADLTSEKTSRISAANGLQVYAATALESDLVRRRGIIGATLERIGSKRFAKRRPDDAEGFYAYVSRQSDAAEPILFRVAFGPLKNINQCGCRQDPDWAEYLAFAQLARLLASVAAIYPHGVKTEIVPDDLRARAANNCPECHTSQYILGLQQLVKNMGLGGFMSVENGEKRLYEVYGVPQYRVVAEKSLRDWRDAEPEAFSARWETALLNAGKNLECTEDRTLEDVEVAAWNYLVAHKAEILSGLWSPVDAFPLCYANHPGNYQIYTLGYKKTKLPWQIELPVSLIQQAA